jgi:hypothetical protein
MTESNLNDECCRVLILLGQQTREAHDQDHRYGDDLRYGNEDDRFNDKGEGHGRRHYFD